MALAMMMTAACSTSDMWDQCKPGEVDTCNYQGCVDCYHATHTCLNNHQWSQCECIQQDPPPMDTWSPDPHDPLDAPLDDAAPVDTTWEDIPDVTEPDVFDMTDPPGDTFPDPRTDADDPVPDAPDAEDGDAAGDVTSDADVGADVLDDGGDA